ncbi:vascular cell adhesion protein 1-like isoform X1 [Carassius gibelio]|uniref:vascular cell adhesion protein 1-like isoform X1 n=1 Tax=Carassius gibelio TaxID=101364 RepID=UPI002278C966|nr:vascular cell adhesion protein 1-like isoform X1 [Carassius gibelio]
MQKGTFPLTTSLRVTYMRLVVLGFFFLCFSLLTGAEAECPLQLDPQRAVVRYGGSVAVNCSTSDLLHKGMGWEISLREVLKNYTRSLITWRVSELKEWNINPIFCYINLNYTRGDSSQCQIELPVTVYKTPDSVSISTVNHRGPMIEGQQYELQCDVHDVAPVQNLTVRWYKNQTLLHQTTFTDTIETPVNKNVTLLIRPDRADIGAQYWCEAELDLGAEGPQPPPKNSSTPLSITVHYKPIINETKLPSVVRVFRGYPDVLVCEADGNPKPTISWSLGTNGTEHNIYSEKLNITESTPENVYCIANNSVGNTTRHVKVSIQEDYLPLIAGLIAVIVAFISVIFIFIFLIYYKTAKMGHYNLKNAKPSAQNGNIAQNGKHNTFPMKKLSQSSILA